MKCDKKLESSLQKSSHFKLMADETEPEVAIQEIQESDALFMELIQEFPTIFIYLFSFAN